MEITSITKILPITATGKLYFKLYYRAQKKKGKTVSEEETNCVDKNERIG